MAKLQPPLSLCLQGNLSENWKIWIKKIELFLTIVSQEKPTLHRHVFFMRSQGQTESIDAYVTDLKNKAEDCEFGELRESLVRDRIVCGIKDDQLRARLLREVDFTEPARSPSTRLKYSMMKLKCIKSEQ